MPSKQSNNRNKVNTLDVCICGLLTAVCIVLGYLESLLPLDFIAPGVKLGLSNCVALMLVCIQRPTYAFAVNITRILLTSLLFGNAVSLLFSLSAGVISLLCTLFISKLNCVSTIGISIAAGAVHNAVQCLIALLTIGIGVVFYIPVLIPLGAVCGAITGTICTLLLKKIKTNHIF